MQSGNQAVVAVASGPFAERLDYTFTSFAQNPFLKLHAFIIGEELPKKQLPGITYHLEKPDPGFLDPMREIYYRRMAFIDKLTEDYVLIVDNSDVLCLQPIPELPQLLRGAAFGACVELIGTRYLLGQGSITAYFNAGVTLWHRPTSQRMREEVVARGRARFRSVEDQLTLNEVMHTRYYDQTVILPSQYNYRALLAPTRKRPWPTVTHLDGVKIYHCSPCIQAAKKLLPVKPHAELADLPSDHRPLTRREMFWRKVQNRLAPNIVPT